MIGKAKSISHGAASIDYGREKLNSYELDRQYVSGGTGKEIEEEFKMVQELNHNCKKNTISVVLSPSPEDGKQLSNKQLTEITQSYLDKMGLKEHQYIAYVHTDKAHKHIHLYVNRVDFNGAAYKDNFIGKRTQRTADEIARDMGLIRAKDIQLQKELGLKSDKQHIRQIHGLVMSNNRPKSLPEYVERMDKKGVKVEMSINKQGKLQGLKVGLPGKEMMKASSVHKTMSLSKIQMAISFAKEITRGISL